MSPEATLEHANLTVQAIEPARDVLLAALPGWRVRAEGRMRWNGKPVRWMHVGTDTQYLALQDGGEGPDALQRNDELGGQVRGVKHLGFVVDDLAALQRRLAEIGLRPDHHADPHPARRRVYYRVDALLELEFVQYLSPHPAERNAP